MTNSKMTKRALFTSIMALMLCFAMLTGTTFAWFTDQETSANNQIIAGNLDIEMYNALTADDNKLIGADTKLFEGIKLEPGAVVYENITVANKGNLALKYQLSVNFTDGGLAKALKVAVVDGGITKTDRAEVLASIAANAWMPIASFTTDVAELKVTDETDTYGIVIYWEPSANDNDHNGKNNKLDIGLTLFATQLAAEKDAFDENYDKDANIVSAPVAIPDDATEAIVLVSSDVKVSVPKEVANALPAEVTSISIAYTEPKVDTTTNTITFDSIELVDQNGKEIDLTRNTEPIAVTLPAQTAILAGENVVVMHDGRVVGSAVVADDGSISYMANHFCEVSVVPVVKVATANELVAAIAKGGNIQLANDITITEKLAITADTVIFGMGKTLTYTGADRAIDATNDGDVDLTINDLTVNCSAGYCQRGINYNDSGDLVLNNVTIKGTNVTYALNLPGYSDNCVVEINNSNFTGNIAMNIWGAKSTVTANNTVFTSVDNSKAEGYVAISLNNDGAGNAATDSVVTINGGKIIAKDENGEPSTAVRVETVATVNISKETEVIGSTVRDVVIVTYEGSDSFYSFDNLQEAISKAIESKGSVKLIDSIELTESVTINGTVNLDLNGHKISGVATNSGNQEMFLIKGNGALNVMNGSIEYTTKLNQGWNAMITIFDVTDGGSLKMDKVKATVAGSDMNFIVHLNNWGTASAEITNCEFNLSYVAVRAFNAGNDLNNVTIKNTKVTGGARLFWVHNYTEEGKDDSTLKLDIYGNNNICENAKPIRFGFTNELYFDLNGNEIKLG